MIWLKIRKTLVPCVAVTGIVIVVGLLQHVSMPRPKSTSSQENHISDYLTYGQDSREWRLMDQRMANRKSKIHSVCDRVNNNSSPILEPSLYSGIVVNDKLKVLYCKVPKVACTNWLKALYIATFQPENITKIDQIAGADVHSAEARAKYFPTLDLYTPEQIDYRLKNYMKFAFVRNPYERLFSAYMNKLVATKDEYFRKRYGTQIVDMLDDNASFEQRLTGRNVSFVQFIRYLAHDNVPRPFNEHWRQYSEICRPCMVDYDIIGKYETMDEDVYYTMKRIGIDKSVKYTGRRYGTSKTKELLLDSFHSIPKQYLKKIWNLYFLDFVMFGYTFPVGNNKGR